MLDRNNHREAGRSVFVGSVKGIANVGAVAVAFVATPKAYGLTIDWIRDYTTNNYGPGWTDITDPIWFLIVAGFVFFTARASVATLLIMGGLAIATRIF